MITLFPGSHYIDMITIFPHAIINYCAVIIRKISTLVVDEK